MTPAPGAEGLLEVLERARTAGFLGPGPVATHLAHAEGFAEVVESALGRKPRNFADLGTGGGVPGLILGARWGQAEGIFVETGQRRCAWLREAVAQLGLEDRIEIVEGRAEAVGQAEDQREQFEVVTARSFAVPAVTAEIAAGLVEIGGLLVVSEPPDPDAQRWPTSGLGEIGFGPAVRSEVAAAHFVVVPKVAGAPDRTPRAVGKPSKRPLW